MNNRQQRLLNDFLQFIETLSPNDAMELMAILGRVFKQVREEE